MQQEDPSYFAAWFVGEVRGHKSPDKLVIRYEELLEGEDNSALTQLVAEEKAFRVRPPPPEPKDREVCLGRVLGVSQLLGRAHWGKDCGFEAQQGLLCLTLASPTAGPLRAEF